MDTILAQLKARFPALSFEPGMRFTWSPKTQSVIYDITVSADDTVAVWSLCHEVGHALLAHNSYKSDFELLKMEAEAWERAHSLALEHNYTIDVNHIEDCLDTYRDWLYQRSTCPVCTSCSLQTDEKTYCCFNCGTSWRVSTSRLCRAYRRKQKEILI